MVRRPIIAFDDVVYGSTAVFSSSLLDALLGAFERSALQVVVRALTDLTSITVQMETSTDGRNWIAKNGSSNITQGSVSQGTQVVLYGCDVGPLGTGALARVRVQLGGAAPSASVRVLVTPSSAIADVPPRVPGCVLWVRADRGVTPNTGNVVSSWADQSGRGNDLIQSTAGKQPVWTPNSINGLPTINFDGSNDVLTATFALGVYTVVLVTSNQTSTNGYFWSRSTGGVESDTLFGSTNSTMYVTRSGTTSGLDLSIAWGQWSPAGAKVLAVMFDGTHVGHNLRINGITQVLSNTFTGNPGTGSTNDTFALGGRADSAVPANIAVAELAIYDNVLPLPQLAAIEEYARRRYQLY